MLKEKTGILTAKPKKKSNFSNFCPYLSLQIKTPAAKNGFFIEYINYSTMRNKYLKLLDTKNDITTTLPI